MKKYLSWKLLAILIIAIVLGFFDLPSSVQTKILPFTPESISKTKINLGLDLQGGSQLDYKIDLTKVPEKDHESIVEGVKEVIEKRVNRLGVAEPNIYVSSVADESHIVVELAETAVVTQDDVDQYLGTKKPLEELTDDEKKLVSLEKAKATVGKTIQLEFKEEKTELDPQEKDKVKENAQSALKKINDGKDFAIIGQEFQQANPGKVIYETKEFEFESNLDPSVKEALKKLKKDEHTKELLETSGSYVVDANGQAVPDTNLVIVKLLDSKEEVKNEKEVEVSHILIAYKGAERADATVTRTEDEAYELAKEINKKLSGGEDFAKLAKEYSNDSSNKDTGGKLEGPVSGDGSYAYDFEKAALALDKEGALSDITKTTFGYHLIKANKITLDAKEKQYKYQIISFSTRPDTWKETGLSGKHFVHADVQLNEFFQPYVSIQFNEEGAKLFEEITGRNVGKRLAIFVGGEEISAPRVNEKIAGGSAQITSDFTNDTAKALARDLNTGAIPAPIILTGEYTIGATLGQDALNKSLFAGLIGFLILVAFMIAYYRIPGIVAGVALLIYGIIFAFLLKAHLHLGISLGISLLIFGFLVSKIVNGQDSGWEKLLSFLLSCIGFFFLTFLLKTGVVVTLAGIAGIIMSFGMAVDANILIFERMKEELRSGKTLGAAIDEGFARAWSSIRDSNFSTLLTCAILFYFGSSVIRGFAFNLATGIVVSMFTAIVITKTLLHGFVGKKIANNLKMFGGEAKKHKEPIRFMKYAKLWLLGSGALTVLAIIVTFGIGLKLGIDFKGGTLLEFKFEQDVTKDKLTTSLKEIGEEINKENSTPSAAVDTAKVDEKALPAPIAKNEAQFVPTEESKIDLEKIQISESKKNNYIVKSKYLTSQTHDRVIAKMKEKLPAFSEPRFTTIGPTLGKTLFHKAIIAMIFALVMIIVYLAFAFRKIPKEVSAWRFGVCAIGALLHDVFITTGVFALLGYFLGVELDALFITALLTVFGYSVNDTIVVYDRLREHLIHKSGESLEILTDRALNETMARSINTSMTTILSLLAVLIFGSGEIFYFVLALTVGIGIGTYSSIFVATPLLILWSQKK